VGPRRGHKPYQQTCSSMGSSLHGSAGPGGSLLQCGLSTGSQLPSGASTCSSMGSSMDCRWISPPLFISTGCRATACLTMVFIRGCRRISAPVPGPPPPPSSSPADLGVCRVVSLPYSHSALHKQLHGGFFNLLKHIVTETLPPSLMV